MRNACCPYLPAYVCVFVCVCVRAHNGQLLSAFMANNCQVPRVTLLLHCKKSKVNVVVVFVVVAAAVAVAVVACRLGKINFKVKRRFLLSPGNGNGNSFTSRHVLRWVINFLSALRRP